MSDGLVLDGVEAGYGEMVVLEGISLALPPGGSLALLGRNGVGKTTLLATIMGHCGLRAGHIRFAGQEVSGLPSHRRVRLGIGLVPQEREIFPSLTVEENLLVATQPGDWSLARIYDLFASLAERRRNRGNQKATDIFRWCWSSSTPGSRSNSPRRRSSSSVARSSFPARAGNCSMRRSRSMR